MKQILNSSTSVEVVLTSGNRGHWVTMSGASNITLQVKAGDGSFVNVEGFVDITEAKFFEGSGSSLTVRATGTGDAWITA